MRKLAFAAAMALLTVPALAQQEPETESFPSPNEIIEQATPEEWVAIPAEDLLVMDLAPDAAGKPRRVIIQLMPPPFSQGWIENIRTLAQQHWWDATSVYRVQDNYVTQWGGGAEEKEPPEGLNEVPESEYTVYGDDVFGAEPTDEGIRKVKAYTRTAAIAAGYGLEFSADLSDRSQTDGIYLGDRYAEITGIIEGWPIAASEGFFSPTHCYGMVGVARGMSPNTGDGTELYTVIGHAPRHLDRNIALVGRVIEGMQYLSSLPRGEDPMGFYGEGLEDLRVPILSVRLGNELEEDPASSSEAVGQTTTQPTFEYLSTESESFARYADARANRRDPFFLVPAGGADICNVPVPIRRVPAE